MPLLARLYFDSNILLSAGWPRLSPKLEKVFSLANVLRVSLYLPEVVALETEAHWIRELSGRFAGIGTAVKDVNRRLGLVGNRSIDVSLPEASAVETEYRATIEALMTKWSLQTVPIASRTVRELIERAARRQPPFLPADKDSGFRDAVILLSVLDHLRTEAGVMAAFVSADARFKDPAVQALAVSEGLQLRFYDSLDQAEQKLLSALQQIARDQLNQDRERATEALKREMGAIERFISETVVFSETDFDLRGGTLVEVSSLTARDIQNVSTTPTPWNRDPSEKVRIEFDVEVEVRLVVRPNPWMAVLRRTRLLKAGGKEAEQGEEAGTLEGLARQGFARAFDLPPDIVRRLVEVEASAKVVEGEYRDISLESARLKSPAAPVSLREILGASGPGPS